ncbi:AMP-binding protein [Xenorhabdus bovienii]|uniref:AMP-binding protein n=1 Tax=Xenorhabdus bovienii TaxID=40576 RepID=UPI003DA6551C
MNDKIFPASFCEEQFFRLSEYDKTIPDAKIGIKLCFASLPDLGRLHFAIELIYMNYKEFHVKYELKEEGLFKIFKQKELSFNHVVLKNNDLKQVEDDFFLKEMDLHTSVLCDFLLIYTENGQGYLLINMLHIAADAYSIKKLLNNLGRAYSGQEIEPYADYVAPSINSSDLKYWQDYMLSSEDFVHLAVRGQPEMKSSFGRIDISINEDIAKQVISTLKEKGISPMIYISWVFCLAIARNTHQNHIGFLHPVSLHKKEITSGCLVNQLPAHVIINFEKRIIEQLLTLRDHIKENLSHKNTPYLEIIHQIVTGTHNNGIFPYDIAIHPTLLRFEMDTFEGIDTLVFARNEQHLRPISFNYDFLSNKDFVVFFDQTIFQEQLIKNIMSEFEIIFLSASKLLDSKINELLFGADSYSTVRRGEKKDNNIRLIDAIRDTAKRTPDAIAIHENQQSITYEQLIKEVDVLSATILFKYNKLLQGRQTEKSILAAIYLDKGYKQICAMLTCFNLNFGYVPLDKQVPLKRAEDIISVTKPFLILRDNDISVLPECIPSLNIMSEEISSISEHAYYLSPLAYDQSRTAYVIPTSGSTGKPKIISMNFRGMNNMIISLSGYFRFVRQDCMLNFSSITFDTSTCEIFPTLYCGAQLSIPSEESKKDMRYLATIIKSHKVTYAMLTPSILWLISIEDIKNIKNIIVMGEKFDASLVKRISHENTCVYNLYGPSESNACTAAKLSPLSEVHLGESLYNCIHLIVDQFGIPVRPGSFGELAIGGECLSDGYLEGDNQYFIDINHREKLHHVYLSKDLVYVNKNNKLIYVDRLTSEVKVNGFRIDTKEIETIINRYQDGILCAVIVKKTPSGSVLKAFISENFQDKNNLKSWLTEYLPYYMIPHQIKYCEIPMNNNKKIDYIALKLMDDIEQDVSTKTAMLERERLSDTEINIINLWESILKVRINSFDDNFFILGGDSLSAINLSTKLSNIYALNITTSFVYNHPTITGQVEKLTKEKYNPNDKISHLSFSAEGVNLFIIHPTAAGSEIYYRLASKFQDKINLIGINSYNLNNIESPIFSIEELACIYGNYMIEHQSDGPYYLAGWSSGGNIAHTIASYLISKEKVVERIFILDSYNFYELKNTELYEYVEISNHDWYDDFLDEQLNKEDISKIFLDKMNKVIQLEKKSIISRILSYYPEKLPCAMTLFKATRPRKFRLISLNHDVENVTDRFYKRLIGLYDNGWLNSTTSLDIVSVDTDHADMIKLDSSLSLISDNIINSMK